MLLLWELGGSRQSGVVIAVRIGGSRLSEVNIL